MVAGRNARSPHRMSTTICIWGWFLRTAGKDVTEHLDVCLVECIFRALGSAHGPGWQPSVRAHGSAYSSRICDAPTSGGASGTIDPCAKSANDGWLEAGKRGEPTYTYQGTGQASWLSKKYPVLAKLHASSREIPVFGRVYMRSGSCAARKTWRYESSALPHPPMSLSAASGATRATVVGASQAGSP
jgi:hypothetical protein